MVCSYLAGSWVATADLRRRRRNGRRMVCRRAMSCVLSCCLAVDHGLYGHAEPLSELSLRLEDVRHEEVHERPQLHYTVL